MGVAYCGGGGAPYFELCSVVVAGRGQKSMAAFLGLYSNP